MKKLITDFFFGLSRFGFESAILDSVGFDSFLLNFILKRLIKLFGDFSSIILVYILGKSVKILI